MCGAQKSFFQGQRISPVVFGHLQVPADIQRQVGNPASSFASQLCLSPLLQYGTLFLILFVSFMQQECGQSRL